MKTAYPSVQARLDSRLTQSLALALAAVAFGSSTYAATLANPNAFAASHRVLDYLTAQADAGKLVSGQQQKAIWGSRTDEEHQYVHSLTTPQVFPAMMALDMASVNPWIVSNSIPMSTVRADTVDVAIDYWQLGSPITIAWHQTNPQDATPDVGGFASVQRRSTMSDAEFHDVVTPGTTLYNKWLAHVDLIAPYLKQLRDAGVPILWRPYHEMNSNWFWWGDRPSADFQQLWINLYDRLVNYHGLNNLIWVWAPSTIDTSIAGFYPGSAYVDVSGVDAYSSVPAASKYTTYPASLLAAAPGKPYTLAECGLFPAASTLTPVKYLWASCWHSFYLDKNWSMPGYPTQSPNDGNTAATVQEFYSRPNVITLDEVNFPMTFEAELVPHRISGGTDETPFAMSGMGNGAVAVHQGTAVGHYIEFDLHVPGNGTWLVESSIARKNDRPQMQLSLVGTGNIGPVVDLYAAGTTPVYSTTTFGTFTNTSGAGLRTFRLTITGKNASSLGYRSALDTWTLTRAPAFYDSFEDGSASDWTTSSGTWSVATDGTQRLQQGGTSAEALARNGSTLWTNYRFSSKLKLVSNTSSGGSVGMIFRHTDDNNYYVATLRQADNVLRLASKKAGVWTNLTPDVSRTLSLGVDYTLEVRVQGPAIEVYFNGESTPAITYTDPSPGALAAGRVGFRTVNATARFDDVRAVQP